ncbi:hypothetical protein RvY_12195-2 [Ramazzottius varieornatus]|uniref:Uncharacterized protein n=1 Tax=Ramazzottius varieornatus TaxID=947166 RepID=A0A1D1VIR4_RAMVA|nr:hypothetical protein RvY_12195-2 [Ramazzottius varieornatus]
MRDRITRMFQIRTPAHVVNEPMVPPVLIAEHNPQEARVFPPSYTDSLATSVTTTPGPIARLSAFDEHGADAVVERSLADRVAELERDARQVRNELEVLRRKSEAQATEIRTLVDQNLQLIARTEKLIGRAAKPEPKPVVFIQDTEDVLL